MTTRIRFRHDARRRRGAILAAAAVGLGAFLALTVVGVDLGRLAFTANEVQALADITAIAGAKGLGTAGADWEAEGHLVGQQNRVDGKIVPDAQVELLAGNYSGGGFVEGATPLNAVQSTANATVNNLVAALIGAPTSTVTKRALAVLSPPGSGQPTLPIALGDCCFPEDCDNDACLPGETHPSTLDNQAWTGFFSGSAQSTIQDFIEAPCGGGVETPVVSVGDSIGITNGQLTPLYNAVECLVCTLNQREFLVPIVECSAGATCGSTQFIQDMTVTGFATITIDSFHYSNGQTRNCTGGGGSPDAVNYHAVIRTTGGSGAGGANGGTLIVTLVE